ncbi:MAG: hypothetical protein QM504_06935, partial [Pseudomonadota bacterium]
VNGDISVITTDGAVTDTNAGNINFIANLLTIEALNGIGSSDSIETQVSIMDIVNAGVDFTVTDAITGVVTTDNTAQGNVNISQTGGDVELVRLQNKTDNGALNIISDGNFLFNNNSVVVDYDSGTLSMQTSGNFYGAPGTFADLNNPDIKGKEAIFVSLNGEFGTAARNIVLDVPRDGRVLIDTRSTAFLFFPETPIDLVSNGIPVDNISLNSSELQIEIETLGDIDPAIFTDLRNFSQEDIAIRLPRDQVFEDELDDYDRLQ